MKKGETKVANDSSLLEMLESSSGYEDREQNPEERERGRYPRKMTIKPTKIYR